MIDLKTMTIQFIDGEPEGIRICRVEGESLVTVVVPREKLAQAKALPELPHRGVYYLLDENHGTLARVYAGQTTQGLVRLDSHKAKKRVLEPRRDVPGQRKQHRPRRARCA